MTRARSGFADPGIVQRQLQQAGGNAMVLVRLVDEEERDMVVLAYLDHPDRRAADYRDADEVVLRHPRDDGVGRGEIVELGDTLWSVIGRDELVERRDHHRRDDRCLLRPHRAVVDRHTQGPRLRR